MKNKELRMKNENYSPMSKLKSIPLSLQASVLPNPFLAPVPFGFAEGLLFPSAPVPFGFAEGLPTPFVSP